MGAHELAYPRGGGEQLAAGARLDQRQVLLDGALGVHVDVQIAQVVLDELYAAGKAFAAVHYFVHAHLGQLALVATSAVAAVTLRCRCGGILFCRFAVRCRLLVAEYVASEEELLL